jgi:hypothetical protein
MAAAPTPEEIEANNALPIATAYVDVHPRAHGLAKLARIIEKHMGALAADLEAHGVAHEPAGHVPGARPPRY